AAKCQAREPEFARFWDGANEANGYRPQISCHHEVNVGLIRTSLCKTNPIPGHRRRDVEGGPGRVRKESGPRVMAVLRSLNIDLCTVSGKASLAAANRHDMCNLEKPVEPNADRGFHRLLKYLMFA